VRLLQFLDGGHERVGRVDANGMVLPLSRHQTTWQVARTALNEHKSLEQLVSAEPVDSPIAYADLLRDERLLPPLTHPDPAHCLVSGTGLTHLGSAAARDSMHAKLTSTAELTDSMKMFKWGVEGGKPKGSKPGMQPEWFYKGNGRNVVASGRSLLSPDFAEDHGEEPELVGLYLIDDDGRPARLGFAIGNEFSDHVTERRNYLYLAHSKLRHCAIGPELRTGDLPPHLEGTSRIHRAGQVLWERPFVTGENNMCHSLANLEYHHFKYSAHRRPGDVHLHFFGTATLSFADGVRAEPGDVFEVDLPGLGAPLSNRLARVDDGFGPGRVRPM